MKTTVNRALVQSVLTIAMVAGLCVAAQWNFLLFHSLSELITVVVAVSIFVVAWNTRRLQDDAYLLILGKAYLSVAAIDLFHLLAYKGMDVFPGQSADLPTQFWIAGRYVEAASLLAAPWLLGRKPRGGLLLSAYTLLTILLVGAILSGRFFPTCYVEGIGLTPFKKVSEYVICALLLAAIGAHAHRRDMMDASVFKLITVSIALKVAAELAFTSYNHVYDLANMSGHLLKLLSFLFIYKAVVESCLVRPESLVYRRLILARDRLEQRVAEGTAEVDRLIGELRRNEESLSEAQRVANVGSWEWDMTDRKVRWSPQLFRILGLDPDTTAPSRAAFVERVHPSDRSRVKQRIAALVQNSQPFDIDHRVVLPDGTIRFLHSVGQAMRTSERGPTLLHGIAQDITPSREAEIEVRRLQGELAHVARIHMLSELSTALAHELNQPLGAILSNAQAGIRFMAADPPDLEEIDGALHDIAAASKRAGKVIRGLRGMVRKDPPKRRSLDINGLVQETVELLRSATIIKNVSITTHFSLDCPPVDGDPIQIQQVIMNLISNSLDAVAEQPEDGRHVHVSTEMEGTGIRVTVSDSGPGISQTQVDEVFDPFVTTKAGGIGMGLPICRSIAETHGGHLKAENRSEGGAAFYLWLPAVTARRGSPSPASPPPPVPRSE